MLGTRLLVVGISVVIVLVGLSTPLPEDTNGLGVLDIATDKCSYSVGETIKIAFSNIGDSRIWWSEMGVIWKIPFEIFDEEGKSVFVTIQPAVTVLWGLSPGEQYNTSWNQTYNTPGMPGWRQVSPGGYKIYANGIASDINRTLRTEDSTWIWVDQPCGGFDAVADTGPNQTVNEGEVVRFMGNATGFPGPRPDWQFKPELQLDSSELFAGLSSIAVSPRGVVAVAWFEGGSIALAVSRDNGETFMPAKTVVNSSRNLLTGPKVDFDSNGSLVLLWTDGSDCNRHAGGGYGYSGDAYLIRSDDDGNTFSNPIQVTDDVNPLLCSVFEVPHMDLDGPGHVYVVWKRSPGPTVNVEMAISRDGGWSFTEHYEFLASGSPSGYDIRNPRVYSTGNGIVALSWMDGRHGTSSPRAKFDIYVARSTDWGRTFSSEIRVTQDAFPHQNHAYNSHVTVADGRVLVAFVSEGPSHTCNDDIIRLAAVSPDSPPRLDYRQVSDGPDRVRRVPRDIAMAPNGTIFAAWSDWRNDPTKCWYSYSDVYFSQGSIESGFAPNLKVNSRPYFSLEKYVVIAAGHDNLPHVAWTDRKSAGVVLPGDIYYSKGVAPNMEDSLVFEWDASDSVDSDGDGNMINDIDMTGRTPTWIYGDDGVYTVTLKVTDSTGFWAIDTTRVTVLNLPPTVIPFGPFILNEGDPLSITATAIDPGSDDLILTWQWDYGPNDTIAFYNDGTGPDPPQSPGGTYPFIATDNSTYTYGDDCSCTVTLIVIDDDGGTATWTTTVSVLNVPPLIMGEVEAYARGSLVLRVAGEKWHDVTATVYRNGVEEMADRVVRTPGSPDDQAVTLGDIAFDLLDGDVWSAEVVYTPEDDPINGQVNGADPAWLIFRSEHGNESRLHHIFNVQHSEAWTWVVPDLRALLVGIPLDFKATATDPSSDDLTFAWDWGDGTPATVTTHFNDGTGPDPYPSPGGTFPFAAMDVRTHVYSTPGIYEVRVRVSDDDGGANELLLVIVII